MADLDDLGQLIKNVKAATDGIRLQFPDKSVSRKKSTIMEFADNIDNFMAEATLKIQNIDKLLKSKSTEVQSAVRAILHDEKKFLGKTQGPAVSFRDALLNKPKPAPKNKIIIKATDIKAFDKQLKQKINIAKNKINVTFYKQINENTCIINTATKEDSNELAQQIRDKIKECTVQEQKLLNPTILLFRTKNISEEDVKEYFIDTTGSEPVHINKISTERAARTYIQLTPAQYKSLPTDGRLRINWEAVPFVVAINPRKCQKCDRYGHPEKFCRASDEYVQLAKTCKENTTCTSCVADKIRANCSHNEFNNSIKDLSNIKEAMAGVDHAAHSKSCPCYDKAYADLKSRIDFGAA